MEWESSREFCSTYGALDIDEFVSVIYQNVLGRSPDSVGRSFWISALRNGMGRGEAILLISNAPEFIAAHPLPSDERQETGPRKIPVSRLEIENHVTGVVFGQDTAEGLPEVCVEYWTSGNTSTQRPGPAGRALRIVATETDLDSDGLGDNVTLFDVDRDGILDGVIAFECVTESSNPPGGYLVLIARDRSVATVGPDPQSPGTLLRS